MPNLLFSVYWYFVCKWIAPPWQQLAGQRSQLTGSALQENIGSCFMTSRKRSKDCGYSKKTYFTAKTGRQEICATFLESMCPLNAITPAHLEKLSTNKLPFYFHLNTLRSFTQERKRSGQDG